MGALGPESRPMAQGRSAAGGWGGAALYAAATATVLLALYLGLHLVGGYRFPIGPDGPVYTWWTAAAGSLGLDAVASGRPGVPAAALVLGGALRVPPLHAIAVLGPVLAAACGLAAAALLETALRPSALRAVAATVLTGAFAAYLAGGWLANLGQVTLLLGALAAFAASTRSWRGVAVGAALLGGAGLAHRIFVLAGLLILAGAVAWLVPDARRRRRGGTRLVDTPAARVAIGGAAGGLLPWLGFAAVGTGAAIPGDTSQDGFFRRLGLGSLLLDRYRERLAGDASRAAVPLLLGGALGAVAVSRRPSAGATTDQSRPPSAYLVGILVTWAAITLVGIVALSATRIGPPNRLLVFSFFVPLAAALGVEALWRPGGRPAARGLRMGVAIVAGTVFVAVAMFGWYRQSPSFSAEELAAARRAGGVVDGLPRGMPVIVLVDTAEPAAAFHVTRFANVIRMGMPPERLPDVRVAVGLPADYMLGRPTLTGDPEHDLIARAYLRESEPVREEAVVLVIEAFNREGFGTTPGAIASAEGVEAVGGVDEIAAVGPVPARAGPAGLPLPTLAGLAAGTLLLLAALGLGWARWAALAGEPRAAVALAPASGLAVAILGGFLADRLAGTAAAPWGPAIAGAVAAAGYVAVWRARRTT